MKCVKCGKSIPKSVNKICDECQKKLLDELKTEENVTPKTKVTKTKRKNVGMFSFGEFIFLISCIIIIVFSVSISVYTLHSRKQIVEKEELSTTASTMGKQTGNTMANIRYYGYCAMENDWIYYFAANEDFSKNRICKIKYNGSNKSVIFEEDSDFTISSINVLNGYVYFTGIRSGAYSSNDEVDNKIYKMKTDGSELEVINDNNFNNYYYSIYAVNDKIYFTNMDLEICRMNLDGSNIESISNVVSNLLGVTEEYMIFDVIEKVGETSTNQVTYVSDLDGNNARPVLSGVKLSHVNIENDYVYYLNDEGYIYKTKIDTNKAEPVHLSKAYLLNVFNNYAYYFDYTNSENTSIGIYKLDLLSKDYDVELVKTLSKMSYYMDVVGEYVNYLDATDTKVTLNLLKTDGSLLKHELFTYKTEDISNALDTEENEID